MKKVMFLVFFIISIPLGYAEVSKHPFSDHIEGLWVQGESGMSQVKEISEQLLIKNPRNLVGLIIRLQYESNHMLFDEYLNTRDLILQVSKLEPTHTKSLKIFLRNLPNKERVMFIQKLYKEYPDYLERDQSLVGKAGVPMVFLNTIRDLEEEGLISISDLEAPYSYGYLWVFVLMVVVLVMAMIYLRNRKRENKETAVLNHHDESV